MKVSDDYHEGFLAGLDLAQRIAATKVHEREASAEASYADGRGHDGAVEKMQGATAAAIANEILSHIQKMHESAGK